MRIIETYTCISKLFVIVDAIPIVFFPQIWESARAIWPATVVMWIAAVIQTVHLMTVKHSANVMMNIPRKRLDPITWLWKRKTISDQF